MALPSEQDKRAAKAQAEAGRIVAENRARWPAGTPMPFHEHLRFLESLSAVGEPFHSRLRPLEGSAAAWRHYIAMGVPRKRVEAVQALRDLRERGLDGEAARFARVLVGFHPKGGNPEADDIMGYVLAKPGLWRIREDLLLDTIGRRAREREAKVKAHRVRSQG